MLHTLELVSNIESVGGKYVPSHPIAGTERSGPDAGYAGLFEGRWCILTPTKKTNKKALNSLETFWKFLGMQTKIMTPEHHDLVLAVTSHAPHLIAYTMVGVVDDLETVTKSEIINYSAAGFRDFTRIAASDPVMWRDIFFSNDRNIINSIDMFIKNLSIEWSRKSSNIIVASVHPGTTDSALSKPFQRNISPEKLYSAEQTAERLITIMQNLTAHQNGKLLNWDGQLLPY